MNIFKRSFLLVSVLFLSSVHVLFFQSCVHAQERLTTPTENILNTGLGALNFLCDMERFARTAQPNMSPSPNSVYDFIVVGAGTAGAAVASRLSEIKSVKVLLIEAGPEESLLMDIPLLASFLQPMDEINWKYETEPSDNYCIGLKQHKCRWPRGKVMGGSSVLNYMIATRGNPLDYDRWAKMGNPGWAYKDVLKYFKKLENVQIPDIRKDKKFRGTKGPVSLDYAPYHTPMLPAFLEGGQELGYPLVDYNGEKQIGFSKIQATMYRGYRMSSNRAYLTGRSMPNLHVTKMSMVHRILIDKETKRAVGVVFVKDKRRYKVYARKEVILCAGAIGSPQLLMLSGIGPAEHLTKLGIEVIKDSRVGDNLMDHIAHGGMTFAINLTVGITLMELMDISKSYTSDFLLEHKGVLTISGGCEGIAFVDVDDPKKRDGLPNMELLALASSSYGQKITMDNFGLNDELVNKYAQFLNVPSWGVFPMLLRPKSRGWIRLRSKDANVKPIIVPNYYNEPEDRRVMVKGIRLALQLSRTKAMQKYETTFYNRTITECEKYQFDSDDYWICNARAHTLTIYHYSGTCKMGPRSDPTAVVDPTLKVIGIKGLRVIDASIMPDIPSAHTNIPVYVIAEKGSDMIKEEWGYLKS
ncbi:glucose dehydrogenase [FAD, quinone]-like [Hylaeus anthracinus]|uniref:glucose dehydrogenase [FAD, quinone]-like n=1 Tax=Hylaeus anthracinus TaxID=313031 RepID=UPI0023BA1B01|nr:glucose dehydrogenase [FAD, quinone]-like [Hylaeus anthracinus]